MNHCPKKYFLTSGTGSSQFKLMAFDKALYNAGIHDYNLVKVSSILPPSCYKADKEFSLKTLKKGSILHAAYTVKYAHKNKETWIGVGVAVPADPMTPGLIVEAEAETENMLNLKLAAMLDEGMKMRNVKDYKTEFEIIRLINEENMSYTCAIAAVVLL